MVGREGRIIAIVIAAAIVAFVVYFAFLRKSRCAEDKDCSGKEKCVNYKCVPINVSKDMDQHVVSCQGAPDQSYLIENGQKRPLSFEALQWYQSLDDRQDVLLNCAPLESVPLGEAVPDIPTAAWASKLVKDKYAILQCVQRATTLKPAQKDPNIYLLDQGSKRLFATPAVYNAFAEKHRNIKVYSSVDCTLLQLILDGPRIESDADAPPPPPPPPPVELVPVSYDEVTIKPGPITTTQGVYRITAPSGNEFAVGTDKRVRAVAPTGTGDKWQIENSRTITLISTGLRLHGPTAGAEIVVGQPARYADDWYVVTKNQTPLQVALGPIVPMRWIQEDRGSGGLLKPTIPISGKGIDTDKPDLFTLIPTEARIPPRPFNQKTYYITQGDQGLSDADPEHIRILPIQGKGDAWAMEYLEGSAGVATITNPATGIKIARSGNERDVWRSGATGLDTQWTIGPGAGPRTVSFLTAWTPNKFLKLENGVLSASGTSLDATTSFRLYAV